MGFELRTRVYDRGIGRKLDSGHSVVLSHQPFDPTP